MARIKATTLSGNAQKTIALIGEGVDTALTLGTTALALPATNLSGRCRIQIQNQHGTAKVYIMVPTPVSLKKKMYTWTASPATANEWYLQLKDSGGDPSLSETLRLYTDTAATGDSLATNGTVGSLTAGLWDWGDNDSLTYNTVYVCTDGTPPDAYFTVILSYPTMPTAANTSFRLAVGALWEDELNGDVRVFGISDTATTLLHIRESKLGK